jgi:hypothetical protein
LEIRLLDAWNPRFKLLFLAKVVILVQPVVILFLCFLPDVEVSVVESDIGIIRSLIFVHE